MLFLDELPEFNSHVLEMLRQPMEDKTITISRAHGSLTFPASFMMIAAMNPCPCGHYNDPERPCTCATGMIQRYRKRISDPLLDRIDIYMEVPAWPTTSWRTLPTASLPPRFAPTTRGCIGNTFYTDEYAGLTRKTFGLIM